MIALGLVIRIRGEKVWFVKKLSLLSSSGFSIFTCKADYAKLLFGKI